MYIQLNKEKKKAIAIVLQCDPYKGKKITNKLLEEISENLDKTFLDIENAMNEENQKYINKCGGGGPYHL
jgi:hypothetical protein